MKQWMRMFSALLLVTTVLVESQLVQPKSLPESVVDVKTKLKFVQVVFRHGDRAPLLKQVPNDPFRDAQRYWPNGLTQLTQTGRARMFRMGEWLRARYADYLGNDFSPREVFARSSASDRCLETIQLVLAGSYPPNNSKWQWDIQGYPLPLARLWQAVPISSFLPMDDDTLLRVSKHCPTSDQEVAQSYNAPQVLAMLAEQKDLLDKLSAIGGKQLNTLEVLDQFWENLHIEHMNGYYWHEVNQSLMDAEFEDLIYRKLKPFTQERWNREFASPFVQRMRVGELLNKLGEDFVTAKSIAGDLGAQALKINFYSTHDTKLAAMMHALGVWETNRLIPFGAAMLFELHENVDNSMEHFVRILYMNQSMQLLHEGWQQLTPHSFPLPFCDHRELCPLELYLNLVQTYLVPGDFDHECGLPSQQHVQHSALWFVPILGNSILFFILLYCVMITWNHRTKAKRHDGYVKLK